jgi:acyl carrier protein
MTRTAMIETVKSILSHEIDIPTEELADDLRLADYHFDSIDVIRMSIKFDNLFQIRVTPSELAKAQTVIDVIDIMSMKFPKDS